MSAPTELRERLEGLSRRTLVATCAALRPDAKRLSETPQATKAALRSLARRIAALEREVSELGAILARLVREAAPQTIALMAIGVEHAGQLLMTAGDNPERLRSEVAFAHLCGVAPIPPQAARRGAIGCTAAVIAPPTSYLGAALRWRIIRRLKRCLARVVFRTLRADLQALQGLDAL